MRIHASLGALAGIAWVTTAAVVPRMFDADLDTSSSTCTTLTAGQVTVIATMPGPVMPTAIPPTVVTVTLSPDDPGLSSGSADPIFGSSSSSCTSSGTVPIGQGSPGPATPAIVTVTELPAPPKSTVPNSTVTVPVVTVTVPRGAGTTLAPGATVTATTNYGNPAVPLVTMTVPDIPGIPGSGATVTIPLPGAPTAGVTITVPAGPANSAGSVLTLTVPEGPGNTATVVLTVTVPNPGSPGAWSTIITAPGNPGATSGPIVTVTFTNSLQQGVPTGLPAPVPSGGVVGSGYNSPPVPIETVTVPLSGTPGVGSSTGIGAITTVTLTIGPAPGIPTPITTTVIIGPGSPVSPGSGSPGSGSPGSGSPGSGSPGSGPGGPGQPGIVTMTVGTGPSGGGNVPAGSSGSTCTSSPSIQLITFTAPPQGTTPGFTGVFTMTIGPSNPWPAGSPTPGQPPLVTVTQPAATVSVFPITIPFGQTSLVTTVTLTVPAATGPAASPNGQGGSPSMGPGAPSLGGQPAVTTITVPQGSPGSGVGGQPGAVTLTTATVVPSADQPGIVTVTVAPAVPLTQPSAGQPGGNSAGGSGPSEVVTVTVDEGPGIPHEVLTVTVPVFGIPGLSSPGAYLPTPSSPSLGPSSGSIALVTFTPPARATETRPPYTVTYTLPPSGSATESSDPGYGGPKGQPSTSNPASGVGVPVTITIGTVAGTPVVVTYTTSPTASGPQPPAIETVTNTIYPAQGPITTEIHTLSASGPSSLPHSAGGVTPVTITLPPAVPGGPSVTITYTPTATVPGSQPSGVETVTDTVYPTLGPIATETRTLAPGEGAPVTITLPPAVPGGPPAVVTYTPGATASGVQPPAIETVTNTVFPTLGPVATETRTLAPGGGTPVTITLPPTTPGGSPVVVTYTPGATVSGSQAPAVETVTNTVFPTVAPVATETRTLAPGEGTPVTITLPPTVSGGPPVVVTYTPGATVSGSQPPAIETVTNTIFPTVGPIATETRTLAPGPGSSSHPAGEGTPVTITLPPTAPGGTPVVVTYTPSGSGGAPAPPQTTGATPGYGSGEGVETTTMTVTPVTGLPFVVTITQTVAPAVTPGGSPGGPGSGGPDSGGPGSGSPGTGPIVVTVPLGPGSSTVITLPGWPSNAPSATNQPAITTVTQVLPPASPSGNPIAVTVITVTPVSGSPLTITVPASTETSPAIYSPMPTGGSPNAGGGATVSVITITPVSGSPITLTVPVGTATGSANQPGGTPRAPLSASGLVTTVTAHVITISPVGGSPIVITVPDNGPGAPATGTLSGAPGVVTVTNTLGVPGVTTVTNTIGAPSTPSGVQTVVISDVTLTETLPIGSGQFTVVEVTTEVTITPTAGPFTTAPPTVSVTPAVVTYTISSAYGSGETVVTYTTYLPIPSEGPDDGGVATVTRTTTPGAGAGTGSGPGAGATVVTLTTTLNGAASTGSATDGGVTTVTMTTTPSGLGSPGFPTGLPQVVTIWPTDAHGSHTGTPIIITLGPSTNGGHPSPVVVTVWPSTTSCTSDPHGSAAASNTDGLTGTAPSAGPTVITIWPSQLPSDSTCTTFSTRFRSSNPGDSDPTGTTTRFTVITLRSTITGKGTAPFGASLSTSCTETSQAALTSDDSTPIITNSVPVFVSSMSVEPTSESIPGPPGQSIDLPTEQSSMAAPSDEIPPPQTELNHQHAHTMGSGTLSAGGYEFTTSIQGYGDPVPVYGTPAPLVTSSTHTSRKSSSSRSTTTPVLPPIPTFTSISTSEVSPMSTTSANATSSTTTSALPSPTSCGAEGDRGEVIFKFDDIPTISGGNATDSTSLQPVPFPYHRFYFSNGFDVVSPPVTRYAPSSGTQMVQYNISVSPTAQIGLAALRENPCLRFDFLGMGLGCNSTELPCVFDIRGLQWNGVDEVLQANHTFELSACPDSGNCTLRHQLLSSAAAITFTNLTAINITLTVGGQPQTWWGDDLQIAWTDNNCTAAACRAQVPNTIMRFGGGKYKSSFRWSPRRRHTHRL